MFEGKPDAVLEQLRRAMREMQGPVPLLDQEIIYQNPYFRMSRTGFQFATPGGARFGYEVGSPLTLDCPDAALEGECQLYQWGTVYGAVAWINGLWPLHASCVAHQGRAIAFTAHSGTGKSTLAAALARLGLNPVCDDTLVILKQDSRLTAIPDAKPAKLSPQIADLLGYQSGNIVPFSNGKRYVDLPDRQRDPLPLTDLVLLEEGPEIGVAPVSGADKLELTGQSLYRGFIHAALCSRSEHARHMLELAKGLNCWKLSFPRSSENLVPNARMAGQKLGLFD